MDIRVSTRDVQQFEGDALAIGVFANEDLQGPAAGLDEALAGVIADLLASGEVTGASDEVVLLHTLGKIEPTRVAIIGLGRRDRFTLDRVRRASAVACRALRKAHAQDVGLALAWADSGLNLAQAARASIEGALLGLYSFRRYKTRSSNGATESAASEAQNDHTLRSITIIGRGREPALRAAVERGQIVAEAANFARDLGNEPANVLTPTSFAERISQMAQQHGLQCEVYGPDWMREQGMGALLGVAQGSAQEPRFVVLRYQGGAAGEPSLALVGKGVTFDTGGISLKPGADMDAMKMDMCGAAAVAGAMQAIARLKPAANVIGIVPSSENMPDGNAYRPGDVLTASNGKTIEINNTDAEGRLLLADALSWAVKQGCAPIVDAATLTGAIVVALGNHRAGLFSNDESLQRTIMTAAEVAGEHLWPMPMDAEYDGLITSDIADIKQSGGRPAGSISAAKVLSNFVDDVAWAHLDIAGVNSRRARDAEGDKGATGFGVRTFAELATLLAGRH